VNVTGLRHDRAVPADSVSFSVMARAVAGEARRLGLTVPAFRSPPLLNGATRTIRRRAGGPMIAVARRGRPAADVAADLIEGVVVANGLSGARAVRCRRRLAAALDAIAHGAAA
jgi:hypothetical protein